MSDDEQIALAAAITAFFMILSYVSLSRGLGKCGGIVGPRNVFDDDDDDADEQKGETS